MTGQLARDLELLIDLFRSGDWREIRVESEAVSVLLSSDPQATEAGRAPAATPAVAPSPAPAGPVPGSAPVESRQPESPGSGWLALPAPNLGTFYRSPKPGAAPFVEVGDIVTPDMEICLLEVMKLFTSVKAGIAGVVRQIAARDAELVEGGQTLFYIEPQES